MAGIISMVGIISVAVHMFTVIVLPRFFCICRHARDIRVHYEQKLERANSLYQELNECMQHLEAREKELLR